MIRDGWLLLNDESNYGQAKGLIPLKAVMQHNKGKVCPVVNSKELNTHIKAFAVESDM